MQKTRQEVKMILLVKSDNKEGFGTSILIVISLSINEVGGGGVMVLYSFLTCVAPNNTCWFTILHFRCDTCYSEKNCSDL